MRHILMSLALMLVCSGCMHAVFMTGKAPAGVQQVSTPYFLGGLVGENVINTGSLCPDGVAMIDAHISFMDGLISVLTLGIYTPKTVVVVCAAGSVEVSDASRPLRIGVIYDNHKRVVSAAMQTTDGRMYVAKGDKVQEVTP